MNESRIFFTWKIERFHSNTNSNSKKTFHYTKNNTHLNTFQTQFKINQLNFHHATIILYSPPIYSIVICSLTGCVHPPPRKKKFITVFFCLGLSSNYFFLSVGSILNKMSQKLNYDNEIHLILIRVK